MIISKCSRCGQDFEMSPVEGRFCSVDCYYDYKNNKDNMQDPQAYARALMEEDYYGHSIDDE